MKFLAILLTVLFLAVPAFADEDKGCGLIGWSVNPTEAGATDDFVNLTDGTFSTTAAAEDELIVPFKVKLHNLIVDVNTAPTVNDTWQMTVMADGVATGLTCDISGATAVSCSTGFLYGVADAGADLTLLIDSDTGTGDPATTMSVNAILWEEEPTRRGRFRPRRDA